jgi:hypothetical protein
MISQSENAPAVLITLTPGRVGVNMDSISDKAVSSFPAPLPKGDYHILIPDGIHVASQYACEGFHYMGRSPRVAVWFKIQDPSLDESLIAALYNVKRISKGGETVRGRARAPEFDAGWKSRVVLDIATLFPTRYSPRALPNCVPVMPGPVRIESRTVTTNPDGTPRPKPFWYSVVHHIVGWVDE